MHYPAPSHTGYGAMKGRESSITPVSFYPVTGQADNCVRTVSYKPFPTQNRLQSLNTSISGFSPGLRVSVADWWSGLFKACYLGLSPVTNSMFSCHCWHPFRNAFTPAVSSHVVAILYCIHTPSQHWGIAVPNYGLF